MDYFPRPKVELSLVSCQEKSELYIVILKPVSKNLKVHFCLTFHQGC